MNNLYILFSNYSLLFFSLNSTLQYLFLVTTFENLMFMRWNLAIACTSRSRVNKNKDISNISLGKLLLTYDSSDF